MANRKKSSKGAKSEAEDVAAEDAIEVSPGDEASVKIEDAEIMDEAGATANADDPVESIDPSDDKTAAEDAAEITEDLPGDEPVDETSESDTEEPISQTDEAAPPPVPAAEPVIIRQGGFVPMVLGGLVAAAIGFGIARFVLPETGTDITNDLQRKIEGQTGVVSKLNERVEALAGLEAALSDNQAAISAVSDRLATLEAQLSEATAQLSGLADQPVGTGASSAELAAQQRELNDLRSAVDAMTEHSATLEKNAQAAAQATLQRAALTRVMTALDAGVSFDSAVADLEGLGVTVPDALAQSASSGVASLATIQESFPDAARVALAVSREAAGDTGETGFTAFLRTQLGARSLEPREGNDPDAVLSRVEAAARDGRLSDALAEIEALPEDGRAELAAWAAQVKTRQEAVSAAQELSAKLN